MKISELLELTLPSTRYAASDILQKAGYNPPENGKFASVFVRPGSPFVLKLFQTRDLAYLNYLKLITTRRNPHFPIIKGKPMKINDSYYGVRLEALTPIDHQQYLLAVACENYVSEYMEGRTVTANTAERMPQMFDQMSRGQKTKMDLEGFARQNPTLAEALNMIINYVIIPSGAAPDLHSGNIMQRADSTLVIIDPVSHSKKLVDVPSL